ncbi:uncharacterized protein LOC129738864 [Uranotaenia lowii]|uniref:uncharacterized protein LOC129738864 n=1 Tax=Uranotaenia lowii TaxID=190385 RepID=UPI00247A6811|nr:uncharacterized protein LOC129738864 [Uranotaenia lowii]
MIRNSWNAVADRDRFHSEPEQRLHGKTAASVITQVRREYDFWDTVDCLWIKNDFPNRVKGYYVERAKNSSRYLIFSDRNRALLTTRCLNLEGSDTGEPTKTMQEAR